LPGIRKRIEGGKQKKVPDFLNTDECKGLEEAAKKHAPRFYPMFLTFLRTGLRVGELIALEWGDVDWNEGYIFVERSFSQGEIGPTKNRKNRKVDMSPTLIQVLTEHRRRMSEEALQGGRPLPERVFTTPGGDLYWPQAIWKNLVRLTKKAGMRKLHTHIFRHTYASTHLKAGTSIAYVSRQLGHSSISITVDVYGHFVPGDLRDAAKVLDGAEKPQPRRNQNPPNPISRGI
jgi:integrase